MQQLSNRSNVDAPRLAASTRDLPRIFIQGFTALWVGAAVGPEGLLVFLCGGSGTFIAGRLKLEKKIFLCLSIVRSLGPLVVS
jgi:H+/Cl- antiporter ClcA